MAQKGFARIRAFIKKEMMLSVSLAAALISMLITPPSRDLLSGIDWKTLATLLMLLSVLDGFKTEHLFNPLIRLTGHIRTRMGLAFFLIFSVFFSSMFVTNDVSLIIFVPLTMMLFKAGDHEDYIIPVLVLENIAAVRGSLLTPFGSPQNLFLYSRSGLGAGAFMGMMLPLWIGSILLLAIFIRVLYRKCGREQIPGSREAGRSVWLPERRGKRILYLALFVLVLVTIVTRTGRWPLITLIVMGALALFDRSVFKRVDYVLLLTFLCFFIFSSSLSANPTIAAFLKASVAGHEYAWSILLSQVISNVPASIVLWPFTTNLKALLYGLDSAGLVSAIGSLASVINMRLYTREYPGRGGDFMLQFEKISLIFFAVILIPQLLIC